VDKKEGFVFLASQNRVWDFGLKPFPIKDFRKKAVSGPLPLKQGHRNAARLDGAFFPKL